jgi:phosphotransferase system  glucose/maltose/N-acetylglucosamine-specific IIC component
MKSSTKTIVIGIVASVAAILIAQYLIKMFNLAKLKQQQEMEQILYQQSVEQT